MSDFQFHEFNQTLGYPAGVAQDSQTNASATATIVKNPLTTDAVYITGFMISASDAPADAIEATLSGPGTTLKIELPAAKFAPITKDFSSHPLRCVPDTDAVLTIPALGSGVVGTVQLFGFYGP